MADSENTEVSEKESAQHEEKEEDTTSDSKKHVSPSKTATSPGSKRGGSSQSRVSRASSTGGTASPKGEKKKAEKGKEGEKDKGGEKGKEGEKDKGGEKGKEGEKGKGGEKGKEGEKGKGGEKGKVTGKGGGKGKGKAKEEIKHEPGDGDEEEAVLPEGCAALFMTSKTQEIFHCVCDVDVTEENPIKIITRQEIMDDMFNRAAVSDFSPFKQQILDFPSDEILIVYDHEFKYGQNFYIALTEEAKELILKPLKEHPLAVETEADELNEEEEEEVIYKYVPPEPKDWVSFGSEKEIVEENVVETRNRVKVSVKRLRKHFGAPCSFTDRNSGDTKQGFIECLPFEDRSFDLKKVELVKATQAVPQQQDAATQTKWKYPRNANTQYYPREFNHLELENIQKSDLMLEFVKSVEPRFNLALQQNAIMNVFYDDWINLGDADDAFGSKADNHLKEYQSFTDLQFSKDKTITCIQWHPVLKGVVAIAVAERLSFDARIDQSAKVIMTPSLILIWSFTDPIHPQLILEAPEDIFSFQFNPTDHNIVAGGCYNGQIILWDISSYADRLRQQRGANQNKRNTVLPGFEDPNALKTPIVRYCAVSSIEFGHKAAITDIQWLPDHMVVTRMGVPIENKTPTCVQLMTCATDHCILFWDTRPPKGQVVKEDDKGPKNPTGVPNTFRHLDLNWKPMLKMYLSKSEPGGDHAPIKFSIQERQGDRSALNNATEMSERDISSTMGGGFTSGIPKPNSGKERTLHSVQTFIYIGTEDGEIVYGDWMPQKDQDSGKLLTPKPSYYHTLHDGPVVSLARSPFLKEVLLSIGGWTFAIWKEGVSSGPILHSAAASVRLTCGYWSPTRPGVFYIAKDDGSIDVWDLLDKTHEPSLTQNVSPVTITCIYPYQVTQKQQLLAVGDNSGTLHILEIPWSLRQQTTGELNGVTNYIEREVKRRKFVVERWNFREQEKQEIAQEAKRKAGIAPNVQLTDEEIEMKQRMEYQVFLNDEHNFLRELGIAKDEDEPLPEV